jgi:hypothetical protein
LLTIAAPPNVPAERWHPPILKTIAWKARIAEC